MVEHIHSSSQLSIEYFEPTGALTPCVFITFTPHGNRKLTGSGFGGKFLTESGYPLIAIKSSSDNWFLDLTHSVLNEINSFLESKGLDHLPRVGYGSSMGGYGAIKFSRALRLSRVLAISPQTDIWHPLERRWVTSKAKIKYPSKLESSDVAMECEYHIFYDSKHKLDAAQIDHFFRQSTYPNAKLHKLNFSGHPSGNLLNDLNLLKPIVRLVATGGDVPRIKKLTERSLSAFYWSELAFHLATHRKPSCALDAISEALKIKPTDQKVLKRKASIDKLIEKNRLKHSAFPAPSDSELSIIKSVSTEEYFSKYSPVDLLSEKQFSLILNAAFELILDEIKNSDDFHVPTLGRFLKRLNKFDKGNVSMVKVSTHYFPNRT